MADSSRRKLLQTAPLVFLTGVSGCSLTGAGSRTTPTPAPTLVLHWLDIANSTEEMVTINYKLRRGDVMVLSGSVSLDPIENRQTNLIRKKYQKICRSLVNGDYLLS